MSNPLFQGIIYSLSQEYGYNPVDLGIIGIEANRFTLNAHNNYAPYDGKNLRYIIEYDSNLGYYDKDSNIDAISWVLFDFKERPISVSKYTIKFGYYIRGYQQKFLLQGSNDNKMWTVIDNRESDYSSHDDFSIQQYISNGDTVMKFRFIRIYLSPNCGVWSGWSRFALTSIEFFGEITELEIPFKELPHSLSFKGTDGRFINGSVGTVLLEGDTFTSTLISGIYTFSVFSHSSLTFIEGTIKLFQPKECEIITPTISGNSTIVKIDGTILIDAPSTLDIEPFVHSSLIKPSVTKNFFFTYHRNLRIDCLSRGRVIISHTKLQINFDVNEPCSKSTNPLSTVVVFLLSK